MAASHLSCVIYEQEWPCQESYIGKTVRDVEIRWQEHKDYTGRFRTCKST